MKKPKCRLCGHEHYVSEDHVFDGAKPKHSLPPFVTKPVTRNVTNVTKGVTRVTKAVTQPSNVTESVMPGPPSNITLAKQFKAQATAEIEALQEEVKRLKRELAEANAKVIGEKPATMSDAERARKYRAAKKGVQDFQG